MVDERQNIQEEIVLGYRLFAALGWGEMGDGHISGRDPEQTDAFWLLNSRTPFSKASIDELVLVGEDAKVLGGKGEPSMPAYLIHYPILQEREELVSVAHTHTPYGTPFSSEVREIEAITQESCIFINDHAVFDDEMVQIQDIESGRRIATSLEQNRSIILRNHGLLTVGQSVRESITWFVLMERVAEAHLKAQNPVPISHNAALFAKEDLVSDAQVDHAFSNLVAHYLDS